MQNHQTAKQSCRKANTANTRFPPLYGIDLINPACSLSLCVPISLLSVAKKNNQNRQLQKGEAREGSWVQKR
jgi:hypothetical protein